MLTNEQFEDYLALCKQIAARMHREDVWPWRDSTLGEDVVDSDPNHKQL
jgi:hypothetical protein